MSYPDYNGAYLFNGYHPRSRQASAFVFSHQLFQVCNFKLLGSWVSLLHSTVVRTLSRLRELTHFLTDLLSKLSNLITAKLITNRSPAKVYREISIVDLRCKSFENAEVFPTRSSDPSEAMYRSRKAWKIIFWIFRRLASPCKTRKPSPTLQIIIIYPYDK